MKKRILDMCCGSRMFYFDKQDPQVLFTDIREFHDTLCDGRKLDVQPDMIADCTDLPFEDETFNMVVFDPPHLLKVGPNSWLCKKYGKLPENWQAFINDSIHEGMRVLKALEFVGKDQWDSLYIKCPSEEEYENGQNTERNQ